MVLLGAMLLVFLLCQVGRFSDRRTARLLRTTLLVWLLGMAAAAVLS